MYILWVRWYLYLRVHLLHENISRVYLFRCKIFLLSLKNLMELENLKVYLSSMFRGKKMAKLKYLKPPNYDDHVQKYEFK